MTTGGAPVPVIYGGTGAVDVATARTNLGVGTASNVQFSTVNTTSSSATQLVQAFTGTASNAGPIQDLYHNSTSASGNPLAEIDFNGKSSAGTKRL